MKAFGACSVAALWLCLPTAAAAGISLPMTEIGWGLYAINAHVGSPVQNLSVLIDLYTSDAWIPAAQASPEPQHNTFKPQASRSFVPLNRTQNLTLPLHGGGVSTSVSSDLFVLSSAAHLGQQDEQAGGEQVGAPQRLTFGLATSEDDSLQQHHWPFDGMLGLGLEAVAQVSAQSALRMLTRGMPALFSLYLPPYGPGQPSPVLTLGGYSLTPAKDPWAEPLWFDALPTNTSAENNLRTYGLWKLPLRDFGVAGSTQCGPGMPPCEAVLSSSTAAILMPPQLYAALVSWINSTVGGTCQTIVPSFPKPGKPAQGQGQAHLQGQGTNLRAGSSSSSSSDSSPTMDWSYVICNSNAVYGLGNTSFSVPVSDSEEYVFQIPSTAYCAPYFGHSDSSNDRHSGDGSGSDTDSKCRLMFGAFSSGSSTSANQILLGLPFLQGYVSVFDAQRYRIGLAPVTADAPARVPIYGPQSYLPTLWASLLGVALAAILGGGCFIVWRDRLREVAKRRAERQAAYAAPLLPHAEEDMDAAVEAHVRRKREKQTLYDIQ